MPLSIQIIQILWESVCYFWTFFCEPLNTRKTEFLEQLSFTLCFHISHSVMDIHQFTISQTASEHGRTSTSLNIPIGILDFCKQKLWPLPCRNLNRKKKKKKKKEKSTKLYKIKKAPLREGPNYLIFLTKCSKMPQNEI